MGCLVANKKRRKEKNEKGKNHMMELFKTNPREAAMLAAAAFVLGAAVVALLGCIFCSRKCANKCAKAKAGGKQAKSAAQEGVKFLKKHAPPSDGSIEIYVGNLSYDLTEERLRKEFEAFGTVNSARIITNRYNGKSKGFGFVHMPNEKEVDAAIAALNDKDILGRKLKCNVAKNVG